MSRSDLDTFQILLATIAFEYSRKPGYSTGRLPRKLERANQLYPALDRPVNRNLRKTSLERDRSPRTILDGLTDVAMPRLANEKAPQEFMTARGFSLPVRPMRALVLGSGAAGLRAAVELKRAGRRRGHRKPKRVRRHVGLLGVRQADASHCQRRRTRRRLPRHGGRARRRRSDGRGHGLCRGSRLATGASSLQFMGLPIPQDRLGGVLALSDRSRRGRARDKLRSAHVAPDGASAGEGSDAA